MTASPLLQLPGAVAASGIDEGVAWHYGDPMVEQRRTEFGAVFVDRSHRGVIRLTGPGRVAWLNTLTSQLLDPLPAGSSTSALILSPQGHVEHHFGVTAVPDAAGEESTVLDTEPGAAPALVEYLERMKFWTEVIIAAEPGLAVLSVLGRAAAEVAAALGITGTGVAGPFRDGFHRPTSVGFDLVVPRETLPALAAELRAAGATPAGSWADDALRVLRRQARIGVDTDERTIPNEVDWLTSAVHLNKGCYRGQETVARVHNLGRPPRRLVLLNLDGSQDVLPQPGDPVLTDAGRTVGRVGTVAQHHEDGPVALALVKRSIQPGMPLLAGGVDARIDPADAVDDSAAPASAAIDRAGFAAVRRPHSG